MCAEDGDGSRFQQVASNMLDDGNRLNGTVRGERQMHIPKSLLDHYPYLQEMIDTTRKQVEYALQQHDHAMEPIAKVIREQVAAYLQTLAYHEERQKRRRATLETMIAENRFCNRKKCKGTLVIEERTGQGDIVLGLSLTCSKCRYEKYPSPEYASCEQADEFLDAAVKLDGQPPFPATYNAFQACELYLRELGGFYHYTDESDEGDFQPSSDKHSLSNLRNQLPKLRRDRLDVKHTDGDNFLALLNKLPNGLWQFLRYREPVLAFPDVAMKVEPSIGEGGRLLVNGTDVYEVLIRMGRMLREFVPEEFRRNLS